MNRAHFETDSIMAFDLEAEMTTGEKIQALRTMKGWSQDDFAARLGTKGPNISRWETNRITPSADTLREIAKMFDVSVDYLLFTEIPLRPLSGFKDTELVEQFNQVDQLDESARTVVKRVIKALAAEQKIRELAAQGP